jgi:hypothetical protein
MTESMHASETEGPDVNERRLAVVTGFSLLSQGIALWAGIY